MKLPVICSLSANSLADALVQFSRMKRVILVALIFVSTSMVVAAGREHDKDVLQLEREACQAFLDGTPAALERVLTDDFTLTLSNGAVSRRVDEINDLRSGKVRYEVFENYDMAARLYGDKTAVVIGKTHVKGR